MVDIKALIREKFGKDGVEKIEGIKGSFENKKLIETNYPTPVKRHFLVFESFGMSIEESYFWMKDMLSETGYIDFEKIIDTFTTSEQSAFFGSAQQRLAAQQDRASAYLATIGKMVKEMFQIVREIRLLEEREAYYAQAKKGDDAAEKTLKGIWIDFVDNGPSGVKASSVYGLASQIGYTILPDLFFGTPAAIKIEEVSDYVKKLEFNEKVKTVLARKLEAYCAWRDSTEREITAKKKFTIQYLRQHYSSIKLYMDWIKPYLRNIKRLAMNPETQLSADIVGAFEGSVLEVEFLAKKPKPGSKPDDPKECVLATFMFRTRPVMQTGQDYSRGPVHLGRMEMTLRGYVWNDDEIAAYRRIKQEEDFELLKGIDSSVEQSMEYLGDDLRKYLGEKGEKFGKEYEIEKLAKSLFDTKGAPNIDVAREKAAKMLEEAKKENKKPSPLEPFTSIGEGFKELASSFSAKSKIKEDKEKHKKIKDARKDGAKKVSGIVSLVYTLYKKSHRLYTI